MKTPATATDLGMQLDNQNFKSMTPIASIIEDVIISPDYDAKHFFDAIALEMNIREGVMPTHMPIVYESVSTKLHQYVLRTHLVFWIHGVPYLFTPEPTIKHVRVGRSLKTHEMGGQLGIPSNCQRLTVIAIRKGCTAATKTEEASEIFETTITDYRI